MHCSSNQRSLLLRRLIQDSAEDVRMRLIALGVRHQRRRPTHDVLCSLKEYRLRTILIHRINNVRKRCEHFTHLLSRIGLLAVWWWRLRRQRLGDRVRCLRRRRIGRASIPVYHGDFAFEITELPGGEAGSNFVWGARSATIHAR